MNIVLVVVVVTYPRGGPDHTLGNNELDQSATLEDGDTDRKTSFLEALSRHKKEDYISEMYQRDKNAFENPINLHINVNTNRLLICSNY